MPADSTIDPARAEALRLAVVEIERHVARGGWDAPIAVFALVRTADALAANPELARELPAEAVELARHNREHVTSIEQDGLPAAQNLEDLLAQLAWPPQVDGAAVAVERIVVPSSTAQDDGEPSVEELMAHPERQDVRIAVGVLRTGESWCALRSKNNDADDDVAGAPDAVPGLVAALAATLAP
ncbi:MAG: PPA1309 family protein [Beutenbergiaceae bacterium]